MSVCVNLKIILTSDASKIGNMRNIQKSCCPVFCEPKTTGIVITSKLPFDVKRETMNYVSEETKKLHYTGFLCLRPHAESSCFQVCFFLEQL